MKVSIYRTLSVLEIAVLVLLVLILMVPIQDYAMREFKEYLRRPSPQTLQAFYDKKQEEVRFRRKIAVPVAAIALGLAIPLLRNRPRKTGT